nr:MAG TPA: hypothetical protein [Caudoviricetes sp.]
MRSNRLDQSLLTLTMWSVIVASSPHIAQT